MPSQCGRRPGSDRDDSNALIYPGYNNEPGTLCILDADGDVLDRPAPSPTTRKRLQRHRCRDYPNMEEFATVWTTTAVARSTTIRATTRPAGTTTMTTTARAYPCPPTPAMPPPAMWPTALTRRLQCRRLPQRPRVLRRRRHQLQRYRRRQLCPRRRPVVPRRRRRRLRLHGESSRLQSAQWVCG